MDRQEGNGSEKQEQQGGTHQGHHVEDRAENSLCIYGFSNETKKQAEDFQDMFGIIKRSLIETELWKQTIQDIISIISNGMCASYISHILTYMEKNFLVIRYMDVVDMQMVDA